MMGGRRQLTLRRGKLLRKVRIRSRLHKYRAEEVTGAVCCVLSTFTPVIKLTVIRDQMAKRKVVLHGKQELWRAIL